MALEAFANDSAGTVTSGGTTAVAAGTVESWTVNVTRAFPVASATASPPTSFYVTDKDNDGEKPLVTACPGGTGVQSWTVTRGADSSTTTTHTSGFSLVQVATGATLRALQAQGKPLFYAANWGVTGDGTTDNGPLINKALKAMWALGGGFLVLPYGEINSGHAIMTSQTIIIPPNCWLAGQGMQTTTVRTMATSNCDVIQFMTYNSASQATILGVAASTLPNCFYGGIRDLSVHGTWNFQNPGVYFHGINATTNPLDTANGTAPSDPDFDPYNEILNVEVRYASGDGFFAHGRSGMRLSNCVFRYNMGNGYTPSYDTIATGLNVGFNGITGAYVNHGSSNGHGKLYNNGTIPQWVSGTAYVAAPASNASRVMYNGVCYACTTSLTSTVIPSTDTTHWVAVSSTSPQAWGLDGYWDSNAYECTWDVDSQEPTAGSFYLKQAKGINLRGVSNRCNFDNPTTGAQLATNPNGYAVVTLDGAVGCNVSLGYSAMNSAAYAAAVINSAASNNVMIAGDGTRQATTSPGSTLTGNYVVIDGQILSGGASGGGLTKRATTGTAGYTLINGTANILTYTAPADGALHSVTIAAILIVTTGETGGVIALDYTAPDNTVQTITLFGGGQSAQYYSVTNPQWENFVIAPGGTVTIRQFNALTAGAAKVYADLWVA